MNINLNRKFSVRAQVLLGAVCGLFDLLVCSLQERFNPVPLFMDTLFTITASFFGGIAGAISAVVFRILNTVMFAEQMPSLAWVVVALTIVLIIRLYVRVRQEFTAIDIVLLSFIIGLIVSAEGALVFSLLNIFADYREGVSVRQMYIFLKSNGLPLFICALLPRVPMNLLDKGICVPLGYLIFVGARKFIPMLKD